MFIELLFFWLSNKKQFSLFMTQSLSVSLPAGKQDPCQDPSIWNNTHSHLLPFSSYCTSSTLSLHPVTDCCSHVAPLPTGCCPSNGATLAGARGVCLRGGSTRGARHAAFLPTSPKARHRCRAQTCVFNWTGGFAEWLTLSCHWFAKGIVCTDANNPWNKIESAKKRDVMRRVNSFDLSDELLSSFNMLFSLFLGRVP